MGKIGEALKKAKKENKVFPKEENFSESLANKSNDIGSKNKTREKRRNISKELSTEKTGTSPIDFRIVVYHEPDSLAAEHFKILRANIMHPRSGAKIKSVLITSALEQEGKTLVSCNLAFSIAQSLDPYVMLIDADVRRPQVHKLLGMQKATGLTDYLQSEEPLSDFLIRGPMDKMTVLQAGSTVRNPAELITSEKMAALLSEARERYEDRFVVIDSPPVNLAAETLNLAQQADAIVLVIRYGVSDKNAIEEAINRIEREKIIGTVFNGFEVAPKKRAYYKSKYYYNY